MTLRDEKIRHLEKICYLPHLFQIFLPLQKSKMSVLQVKLSPVDGTKGQPQLVCFLQLL